jgi:teichuronic acid biosynthesis glycosyltransferase TuaG
MTPMDPSDDTRPEPTYSVVVPVYDEAECLAELYGRVREVLTELGEPWELLLVDDGSTDGSRALAERLAEADPRIRVLGWAENRGAAAARNAAIRAARGRFIAFLDADDLWRPEKLARQIGLMEAEGHAFVFSSYQRIDAEGRPLGVVRAPSRVTYRQALGGNPVGCMTAVYDAGALGKMEMPDLRRRQDYGLWLAILRRVEGRGMAEVLADYRVGRGSLSANKLVAARATWAVYRQVEAMPPLRAGWHFLQYAAKAAARRL